MNWRILLLVFISLVFTFIPSVAYAQLGLNPKPPSGIAPAVGNSASTLTVIIKNVVILFYSIGALGFTIMIIWAAVSWIISGGDKEKIAKARTKITTALIGLFLLALSFPIISLIGQISGIDILGNLPLKNIALP